MSTDYVGFCACGCIAGASCKACGAPLCEEHSRTYPQTPSGVSEFAAMQYARAVRLVGGVECESCRAEKGRLALQQALNTPSDPLPDHWLDRAIALRTDQTRNEEEKRVDGELPVSLTAADVVDEFLRRIDKEPHERAQVLEGTVFRKPEFARGWKIHCLRNEYTQQYPDGSSARHPLPVLVTPEAELLGPPTGVDEQNLMASTWEPVYETEIDLGLFVSGVANILVLSRFHP
ncbi:MAG: hypothetical protein ACRDKY_03310 [Solirubrobacteraceae bacterium]